MAFFLKKNIWAIAQDVYYFLLKQYIIKWGGGRGDTNAEGEQAIANPPNNSKLAFPSSNLEQLKNHITAQLNTFIFWCVFPLTDILRGPAEGVQQAQCPA